MKKIEINFFLIISMHVSIEIANPGTYTSNFDVLRCEFFEKIKKTNKLDLQGIIKINFIILNIVHIPVALLILVKYKDFS